MNRPLGYLFWHRPQPGAPSSSSSYEEALADFHRSLLVESPPGFVTSWTWRMDAPPWFTGSVSPASTYLDMYVTAGLRSLGDLEEAAVSGHRRLPHDRAAASAAAGAGGLMQSVAGRELTGPEVCLSFVDKPAGDDRKLFVADLAALAGVISVWMRRLVLGPGPEYLVVSAEVPVPESVWWCRPAVTITAASD